MMAQSTTGNMDLLKATLTPKPSSPSSFSSTPSTSPRSSTKATVATPTQRNLSSFAPLDRDQFIGRLATFKDVFWSQLPKQLCELEWAQRGWVARKKGPRGVECGLCNANVQVVWEWSQLQEYLQQQSEENGNNMNGTKGEDTCLRKVTDDAESAALLLKHYEPLLSAGHASKCPWRSRTTDINVLRLPPHLLSLPSLLSRLTTLISILPFLPSPEKILQPKPLPSNLPTSLEPYEPRLVELGITGWSGSLLADKGILICENCHRRVGLWLFQEQVLDLVAQHKWYCPWINEEVQAGMKGWEYMVSLVEPRRSSKRSLEGDGHEEGRKSRFKKLREMLKGVKK